LALHVAVIAPPLTARLARPVQCLDETSRLKPPAFRQQRSPRAARPSVALFASSPLSGGQYVQAQLVEEGCRMNSRDYCRVAQQPRGPYVPLRVGGAEGLAFERAGLVVASCAALGRAPHRDVVVPTRVVLAVRRAHVRRGGERGGGEVDGGEHRSVRWDVSSFASCGGVGLL